MRKLLISLLLTSGSSAFAASNALFQEFDNQVSIGYGRVQTLSSEGTHPGVNSKNIDQNNLLTLEAERLFDNGLWLDANANMAFGAGPLGTKPFIGQGSDYGINVKAGYGLPLSFQHTQLIPYAAVGLNNRAQYYSGNSTLTSDNQIANSFAYTGGLGARIEGRLNRTALIYFDQLAAYNWDQSSPLAHGPHQNFASFTSTLGAKFNVAKNFQVGVKGFYTNYQPSATNYEEFVEKTDDGTRQGSHYLAQPQYSLGGLLTVGVTY